MDYGMFIIGDYMGTTVGIHYPHSLLSTREIGRHATNSPCATH